MRGTHRLVARKPQGATFVISHMLNMIINKQITIIITCPKPVVSPKLIYDKLRLRFLGT